MELQNCKGYEQNFIKLSEKDLLEHVLACPECRAEHRKMQQTVSLIKETKGYFKKKNSMKASVKLSIAASIVLVIFAMFTITTKVQNNQIDEVLSTEISNDLSAPYEDGFAVDEYGLLIIEGL